MSAVKRVFRGSWMAVWGLAAACSSSKKIDVGGDCLLNSDCNPPLSCTFGKCHNSCKETRDCPLGQSCIKTSQGGTCQLPSEADCRVATCAEKQVCAIDYRCRATCQIAVTDCTDGQVCVGNVCADESDVDQTTGQLPVKNPAWLDGGLGGKKDASLDGGGAGGAAGSLDGGGTGQTGGAGGTHDASISSGDGGVDGARATAGAGGNGGAGAGGRSTGGAGGGGDVGPTRGGAGGGNGGVATGGIRGGTDAALSPGTIWHVKQASEAGDGRSWGTAFATLQEALTNSLLRSGDQIWIAQGTYTPAASGGSRTTYFYLMNGVALYGGFRGTEVTLADRGNPVDPGLTVLSGDLAADDGIDTSGNPTKRTDNTYHVVVGASNAVLDGLTITGGNANGSAAEQQLGGGMYNLLCDGLRLLNVRLVWNLASGSGGGLYNTAGSYTTQTLANVVFAKNRAGSAGGGFYNSNGNATLTDVTFASNSAAYGGGMTNAGGGPSITRATFVGNSASSGVAGGLQVAGGNPTLTNVVFGGNVVSNGNNATYGGGMDVTGTSSAPVLTNVSFVGNMANNVNANATPAGGGGISLRGGSSVLVNVTIAGNWTNVTGGAGITHTSGTSKVTNSVIWGNYTGANINETKGTGVTFARSNVHNCGGGTAWSTTCGTDGGGNVDTATSPFASYRAPSGSWTAAPAYSADLLQTTFTNTLAPWVAGELVGMFIRPDTSQPRRLPILANTATTLTVWGDAASTAANGTMYDIYDVRLAAGNACTDAGDNAALPTDSGDVNGNGDTTESIPWDLDCRPRIINGTVDMGAYENQGG